MMDRICNWKLFLILGDSVEGTSTGTVSAHPGAKFCPHTHSYKMSRTKRSTSDQFIEESTHDGLFVLSSIIYSNIYFIPALRISFYIDSILGPGPCYVCVCVWPSARYQRLTKTEKKKTSEVDFLLWALPSSAVESLLVSPCPLWSQTCPVHLRPWCCMLTLHSRQHLCRLLLPSHPFSQSAGPRGSQTHTNLKREERRRLFNPCWYNLTTKELQQYIIMRNHSS